MRKQKQASDKHLKKQKKLMHMLLITILATVLMLIARYLVQNTAAQVCYIIATVMYIIVLIRLYRPKDSNGKQNSISSDVPKFGTKEKQED